MIVSHLRVTRASPRQVERGHLAWLAFRLDGKFEIDGVALRKTEDGRSTLKFPYRHDGVGIERAFFKPVDAGVRAEIEKAVLDELARKKEAIR